MYELYLLTAIAIPTSALSLVVKGLMVLFFLYGLWKAIRNRGCGIDLRIFVGGLFYVLFYFNVGLVNGNNLESVVAEASVYGAFVAILYSLLICFRLSKRNIPILIICISFYIAVKISLFVYLSIGIVTPLQAYWAIKAVVPSAVINSIGGTQAPRVVFANDFMLPMFLFWFISMHYLRLISAKVLAIFSVLILVLILLTLSRYLYLLSLVVILCTSLLYFKSKTVVLYSVVGLAFVILIPAVVNMMGYEDLIGERLFGSGARGSDMIKIEQLAILDQFEDSPIFGRGFGLDLNIPGRDLADVFQAEVQWLALMAKTGVVGIAFGVYIIGFITQKILRARKRHSRKLDMIVLVIFFAWLFAGWSNPVIFLTSTTINYLLLYSIHYENKRRYALL